MTSPADFERDRPLVTPASIKPSLSTSPRRYPSGRKNIITRAAQDSFPRGLANVLNPIGMDQRMGMVQVLHQIAQPVRMFTTWPRSDELQSGPFFGPKADAQNPPSFHSSEFRWMVSACELLAYQKKHSLRSREKTRRWSHFLLTLRRTSHRDG